MKKAKVKLSDNPLDNFWMKCDSFGDKKWSAVYQNRWKQWVTTPPNEPKDMSWPGTKSPEPGAVPVLIGDSWYWSKKPIKKIFVICTVRGATPEYQKKLEDYVKKLEDEGNEVHLPHRDTNQNARGYDICLENMMAIIWADEIHIFYNSKSQGTHFDMGVAFALRKKIVIVENEPLTEGKSYQRMLTEWEEYGKVTV